MITDIDLEKVISNKATIGKGNKIYIKRRIKIWLNMYVKYVDMFTREMQLQKVVQYVKHQLLNNPRPF